MTKKYIHRELILGQLGYDYNPDVKAYIDFFDELVGDISTLNKIKIHEERLSEDYLYVRDNNIIFFMNCGSCCCHINVKIWAKFEEKFNLSWKELDNLMTIILSHKFNMELDFSEYLPTNSHNHLKKIYL